MSYDKLKNHELLLSIGSNLGKRKSQINKSLKLLENYLENPLIRSQFYESIAWGYESNSSFLNICAKTNTSKSPEHILKIIHSIEQKLGREHNNKTGYSDRTIDIDILFYGKMIVNSENLKIPHPFIYERQFVLKPLYDISPTLIDPRTGMGLKDILNNCNDQTNVLLYEK